MWEVASELNHLESWARDRDSRVSEVQSPLGVIGISHTRLSLTLACLSRHFCYPFDYHIEVPQPCFPLRKNSLGCSPFARRY